MEGWIKIHRKILDWEWYSDVNTKSVFLHLLLTANTTDRDYRGCVIKRGDVLVSISQLSNDLGISCKAVRTALEHLERTKEIGKRSGKPIGINSSIVTICKFDDYNPKEQSSGKPNGKPIGKPRANQGQTPEEKVSPIPPLKEDIQELKTPPIIPPRGYENFSLDFINLDFWKPFSTWLSYKSERKENYKSETSLKVAYNHLVKISHGNPAEATEIVEHSITCGYQGLFELKNSNNNKSGMSVGVILNERPKYTKGW